MDTVKVKQLFCLPYAGGNASFYNHWKEKLNPHISLVPIEYSGHGARMGEELAEDVSELIEDVCKCILAKKKDMPFSLFGYSMGAKLCMLVVERLLELTGEQPETLFLGAAAPPHISEEDDTNWENEDELRIKLSEYGGMPEEVLESEELCELFFPIIKSDFNLCSKIYFGKEEAVCASNLLVFYSPVDDTQQSMTQWTKYTTGKCELRKFEGTHFFINEYEDEILNLVNCNL